MQSDFSCCLSFIQMHVHLQGVILSLLTFYFRSGLSFVEMYIEWRGKTCLLWLHTHTHTKITTSDGVVHYFIISWKHSWLSFLIKCVEVSTLTCLVHEVTSRYTHFFFHFVTEYKWNVLYMYIKSLLKLR